MDKIRLAVVISRNGVLPWQQRLLERIKQEESLSLKLVLELPVNGKATSPAPGWPQRVLDKLAHIERKYFVPGSLIRRETLSSCSSSTNTVECHSHDLSWGHDLQNIDLVIALDPISITTATEIATKNVLWVLASGQGGRLAGPNFGFWEMFGKEGISRLALVEMTQDGRAAIAESFLQIQYCYSRNKLFLQEKSVPLILRELQRLVLKLDVERPDLPKPIIDSDPQRVTAGDLVRYLIGLTRGLAPKVYKALLRRTGAKFNRWSLFVGQGMFDPDEMSQARETALPADEFWADPFMFRRDGAEAIHVFYEAYEFSRGLGKISVGRLTDDQVEYVGDALVRPYHLSYPFVFSHQNGIYMIPETAQNRQIEIWQADEYPLQWSLHKTAMVGQSCADTTIFEHDGDWWMFTNLSEDGFDDHCSELYAFKVDSPMLAEITPHKLNPIVTDARTARNAGRIAIRDGKLTRLAQNNAYHYGYGFSLMEIEELSLERYVEKPIHSVRPGFSRGITSTHQMDHLDDIHIFDGLREFG